MNRDLITLALQEFVLRDGKELNEVQQYLRMKYNLDVDQVILKRRLEKMLQIEKAVA